MASGADLSCNSYHKTMTSLGQASIVNRRGGLIPDDRFKLVFDLFQTTSPSSLILGSIDGSRRLMATRGQELWGKVVELAAAVRAELEGFNGLRVLRAQDLHSPGAVSLDPIKLTFDVSELGITGYEACDWLVENHHLRLELSDHRHLIALLTTADDAGTVARLIAAMRELTKAPRKLRLSRRPTFPPAKDLYAELIMTPAEAVFGKTTHVPLRSAVDRIVAETVSPYPPGIPRLVPGERVTEAIVEYLELGVKEGMFVEDAADPTLATLRVVA
jgi:arginine decarboxylase